MNARHALLTGLIDYAGLFPPAGLDMASAVESYVSDLTGEHAWMLGRFIVPWARLAEFEEAASSYWTRGTQMWRISVLGDRTAAPDASGMRAFHQRWQNATIDGMEVKASSPEDLAVILAGIKGEATRYAEIPLGATDREREAWLCTLKKAGARAKIRTGGVTPQAIPAVGSIAEFLVQSAHMGIAFKATAGLHHPVRSERALTYQADSPSACMHGFLNLFVAAAVAYFEGSKADVEAILSESSPESVQLEEGFVIWGTHKISSDQIFSARSRFAISFGSCSFQEPVNALQSMGWL